MIKTCIDFGRIFKKAKVEKYMSKNHRFETLRTNISNFDLDRTIGFLSKCDKDEQQLMLHDIKRNQLFAVKSPNDFTKKLNFIIELNNQLIEEKTIDEMRLYFEFIEAIYKSMELLYNKFDFFYASLETTGHAKYFISYIFILYSYMVNEASSHVEMNMQNSKIENIFDSTSSIAIPNRDGHFADIDTMIEFYAKFIKLNVMFYKFKSNTKLIEIIPITDKKENIVEILQTLFQTGKNDILESFNAWENGVELIDLVNLFDWEIDKQNTTCKTYFVKAKKERMNEYVNKEFGLYLYLNLKHGTTFIKSLDSIVHHVQNNNFDQVVNLEYSYILDVFSNQYFISPNIFNEKHNGYALATYVKFYLLFRVYFFYFSEQKEDAVFIIDYEFILKLVIYNQRLFQETIDTKFIDTCMQFYINNGDDVFNYPFFKYDFLQYAIPRSIKAANTPRIFIERFQPIVSNKKLADKGQVLEKYLLLNQAELNKRGIKIEKNIKLKRKKQTVGEIDILLYDGKNLIIAELKNQTIFNCTKEMYNRKKDLKNHAVVQINKAKKFLLDNKQQMSKELSIDLNNVKEIIPIVITTIDEFNNMILGDTLVVSAFVVKMYFENDHFAIREVGLDKNTVVEKRYFNSRQITLESFIKFVRMNRPIKILNYFKDKKITYATTFRDDKSAFKRTILTHKRIKN